MLAFRASPVTGFRRSTKRLDCSAVNENNVRVRWIGRQFNESGARTPAFVQRSIEKAIDDTRGNTGMTLTVAFDYGSRVELTRSARLSSDAKNMRSDMEINDITQHLYDPEMPPVDVLIRTSGESRISNFLLWQICGAKVFFTERTWPECPDKTAFS